MLGLHVKFPLLVQSMQHATFNVLCEKTAQYQVIL
jgi:hypothetical protein